jgi:hypothetical protein
MWNFRKKESLPKQKDFVIYKDYKPARIVGAERRGRKTYLLISWTNLSYKERVQEKWVKASECIPYTPLGKKTLYQEIYGAVKLTWFQNLIVKLQNWYYGR